MTINIYLNGAAGEEVSHQTIEEKLNLILLKEIEMAKTLDDVLANVAESKTLVESMTALMSGLREQLNAALVDLSPDQQAKVDEIFAAIDADQEAMTASVIANTTVVEVPVEVPVA